jgi:transcriptional regulator with XRE-family HTH domain
MGIGQKIRQLREQKGISQGDIEKTTGMLRGYISRVEHGHTVPSLETLERFAGALDVPLHEFFRDWEGQAGVVRSPQAEAEAIGFLTSLRACVQDISEPNRALLLDVARKLAYR